MKHIKELLIRTQYTGKWGCQRYLGKYETLRHCLARLPDRKDESKTYDPKIFRARPQAHHEKCAWLLAWNEYKEFSK